MICCALSSMDEGKEQIRRKDIVMWVIYSVRFRDPFQLKFGYCIDLVLIHNYFICLSFLY